VTRANILRSARMCFALRGFGVATNREIAERAGVTAAAIYQYFDSKVDLYLAAASEAIDEVAEHMHARAEGGGRIGTALSGIVTSLLALHESDPSLAAFLSEVPSELQRHPEIARGFKPDRSAVVAILSNVIGRAVTAGELDAADAGPTIEMFIACLMGLSQYAALNDRGRPAARAFAELLEGRLFERVARVARKAAATTKPRRRRK
jgi:AcrR family transcriptional regulator